MSETFPQSKKWIDKEDPEGIYSVGRLPTERQINDELESIKPALEDFFSKVVSEKPDYIILLDKGARVFGVPFNRYLHDLKLEKIPKILFWNDDSYKMDLDKTRALENMNKDFIDSDKQEHFGASKLFVVDEVISGGTTARLLRDFWDKNNINGHYFAFNSHTRYRPDDKENEGVYPEVIPRDIEHDSRFTIYPNESIDFFTKEIANLYVTDSEPTRYAGWDVHLHSSDKEMKTEKRFQYVDAEHPFSTSEEIENKKELAEATRRMAMDLIYETLKKLDLSNTK